MGRCYAALFLEKLVLQLVRFPGVWLLQPTLRDAAEVAPEWVRNKGVGTTVWPAPRCWWWAMQLRAITTGWHLQGGRNGAAMQKYGCSPKGACSSEFWPMPKMQNR